jgi:hypothetical protein
VEYGALATAPGPLLCERARLYCFFLRADRARIQHLCDRVLSEPTDGAVRYRIPRLAPVVLSFGAIGGLRSLDPAHAGRGSAFEPEAAIWLPVIAQRRRDGAHVDRHLAVFMPYIWVDDPIAFAAGREVYGFAKTQGWMGELPDPRETSSDAAGLRPPDPPDELYLDVYGAPTYRPGAELGRTRLITINRAPARRGEGPAQWGSEAGPADGSDLAGLLGHFAASLEPELPGPARPAVRRSALSRVEHAVAGRAALSASMTRFVARQVVHHVFLKQFRDAQRGHLAALQQVVEARSSVVAGSLRWRRLTRAYDISIESLASQPLHEELGIELRQTARHAFAAEFGFRMEPGVVVWPA